MFLLTYSVQPNPGSSKRDFFPQEPWMMGDFENQVWGGSFNRHPNPFDLWSASILGHGAN